ncbi:hypothetical protein L083_6001 [Actinoplanes sp. N902-109]|nr:hypothetical protein L083_6001 [Actinoplanes sp. N902-109]
MSAGAGATGGAAGAGLGRLGAAAAMSPRQRAGSHSEWSPARCARDRRCRSAAVLAISAGNPVSRSPPGGVTTALACHNSARRHERTEN